MFSARFARWQLLRYKEQKRKKEGTGKGKAILKVVGQFLVHLPKATVEFDGIG